MQTYYSVQGMLEGNRSFTGASGARRTVAWYPSDVPADQVNVTLTITNTSKLAEVCSTSLHLAVHTQCHNKVTISHVIWYCCGQAGSTYHPSSMQARQKDLVL